MHLYPLQYYFPKHRVIKILEALTIFLMTMFQHLCSLPKRSRQPTAMGFHPSEPVIAVVYADRQVYMRTSNQANSKSGKLETRNLVYLVTAEIVIPRVTQ